MDKQREDEICKIFEDIVKKHPDATAEEGSLPDDMRFIPLEFWQAAQAAMQPDIDRLASDKDELNDLAEKQEQQLSTAKHRIEELEKDYVVWREYTGKVNDRNIEPKERIRVADAEEPVAWMYSDEEGNDAFTNNPTFMNNQIYHGHLPVPLYLHAQIPAEVDLKAKIAELETSEKEGWRYADELEQERKRLEAIIKEYT